MGNFTGYELSRQWFDFAFENPEKINPNHTAMYFFAIEHCNRLGWKEKFGFPSTMAMEAMGVKSYNTYKKTLDDLVDWGFFTMVERSKNQYSSNVIALSKNDKALDKALDKAMIKHNVKQSESKESIDKQTNQVTKEPSKHAFSDFWDLYDKKRDKKKCKQKWSNISEKEKEKIMEFIPIYKEAEPDDQFRKYPYTFLNSEIWNDDWDEYKEDKPKIDMRRFY